MAKIKREWKRDGCSARCEKYRQCANGPDHDAERCKNELDPVRAACATGCAQRPPAERGACENACLRLACDANLCETGAANGLP